MTVPTKPHLWQVIWAAIDSNNPGDVCPALITTYSDLVADAVLKHFDQLVEEWQRNDEAMLAENQRLADKLTKLHARYRAARAALDGYQQAKPNPWFTPAEFPIEQYERADRERVETVRRIVEVPMISAATGEQIKASLTVTGAGMREMLRLRTYEWPEGDDDERTVRTEAGP